MAEIIKDFSDGSFLEYDKGKFDVWCVYLTRPNKDRKPPRDTGYFNQLIELSQKWGEKKVYSDYVRIYNRTSKTVDNDVLQYISEISKEYAEDALKVDIIFSVLYMAMIAEERKEHTKLGKRIKHLGIYSLLIEHADVYRAANFMRGMGWREIAALCQERGF